MVCFFFLLKKLVILDSANAVDGTVWWRLTLDQDLIDTLKGSFPNWFKQNTTNTTSSITATVNSSSISSNVSSINRYSGSYSRKRRLSGNSPAISDNTSTKSDSSDYENDRCLIKAIYNQNNNSNSNQKRKKGYSTSIQHWTNNTFGDQKHIQRSSLHGSGLIPPISSFVSVSVSASQLTAAASSFVSTNSITSESLTSSHISIKDKPNSLIDEIEAYNASAALTANQHSSTTSLVFETVFLHPPPILDCSQLNYKFEQFNTFQEQNHSFDDNIQHLMQNYQQQQVHFQL